MVGTLIAGAVIFLAGFVVGAFVFRNNPVTGEKVAAIVEKKVEEGIEKIKEAIKG